MIVELTDFKTKEKVDELEVDAVLVATGRAPFTQVGGSLLSIITKPFLSTQTYGKASAEWVFRQPRKAPDAVLVASGCARYTQVGLLSGPLHGPCLRSSMSAC